MKEKLRLALAAAVAGIGGTMAWGQTPTWTYDPNSGQYPNETGQPFEAPGYQAGDNSRRNIVDIEGGQKALEINTTGTGGGMYWSDDAPNPNWNVSSATGYSVEWKLRMDPNDPTSPSAAGMLAGTANNYAFMRFYDVYLNPFNGEKYLSAQLLSSDANPGAVTHSLGNRTAWHTYRMDVQDIAGAPTAKLYVDNYHSPVAVKQLTAGGANSIYFGDVTGSNDGKYQTAYVKTWQNGVVGAPALPNAASLSHTMLLAQYNGNMASGGLDADFARVGNTAVGTGGVLASPGKFGNGALDSISASGTVNYPTPGNFNPDAGTVEMWVKPNNWANGSYDGFFDVYEAGLSDIRLQKTSGGKLQAYAADIVGGSSWSITTADPLTLDNNWHHIAWTWDKNVNMTYLYLDGQVVADIHNVSVSNLTGVDFLGTLAPTIEVGSIQNGSAPYDGLIDEFRISDMDLYQGAAFTPATAPFTLQEWAVDAPGNWSVAGNWTGNVAPDYVGATANFTGAITGSQTVTVDGPRTVGIINFNNSAASYTVAGSDTLTVRVGSGVGEINVLAGSHTISAPVMLAGDTKVTVTPAASVLTMSGDVSAAAGSALTKEGAGTLAMKSVRVDGLVVNTGTVQVLAKGTANDPAGTSVVRALAIAGGPAAPTATLDLTNNSAVVDYSGTSPLDDVRQLLKAGSDTGKGIVTSSGDANRRLGYAEASALGLSTFAGQSVDADSVLIKFTYAGDTNLDGQVDVIDLGNLATAWQTNASWMGGDSNYDAFVDVIDLGMLATNWQAGVGSPLGPGSLDQALAAYGLPSVAVPEPAAMALIGLSAGLMLGRKRR